MKPLIIVVLLLCVYIQTLAQMPNDAIYMPKNQVCLGTMYTHSRWNQYWENTLKRENLNIGTHTTQNIMLMPSIGVTDRFNIIVALPYVWTKTSAGNLLGQKGFQDLSGWLKWKPIDIKGFSVNTLVGASIPISKYVPDFLPMSIGLGCSTVSGRLLTNYRHPQTGIYLTGHATYIWRSNISLDRDSYLAYNRIYYSNNAKMPNAYDLALRIGILKSKWQTEIFTEKFSCIGGDYIRRNDMPFPTNDMEATTVGWYGKFQPKMWGLNARFNHVVSGKNVGQSTTYTIGLLYQFGLKNISKSKTK